MFQIDYKQTQFAGKTQECEGETRVSCSVETSLLRAKTSQKINSRRART